MPGDPIDQAINADPDIAPVALARLRQIYGIDTPIAERHRHWAAAALHGDLGFSRTQHRPVMRSSRPLSATRLS